MAAAGGAAASLVKYDNPVLVSTLKKGKKGEAAKPAGKSTTQTEDVLNSILPPKEWTQDGQLWVQYVSSTPATRIDVINLQEHLDHQLQQRQARETGICPIREELYAQCFDELIRQTTMNCLQRGLLLVRVRDEIRMTIAAYQTLYESSIAFGMRKALMAEQRKGEMRALIASLSSQKAELEAQVASLEARIDDMQREEERRAAEEKREHEAEVAKLRETHDSLKTQLEDLLAPPGKK